MLERTLEPEVMDDHADALAYDVMDHAEVNRAFVDDLRMLGKITGEVLDVGTGTSQIPITLCRCLPSARVMAIDLSAAMLDLAMANVAHAGLTERITLRHVDAKRLPLENDRFDAVVSNSIVHHVADPMDVLREAWRVLRPGGHIFFRDLMRPRDVVRLEALVETHALDATPRQRELFADSLHAALRLDETRELIAELGISPETVTATSDRHWTWSAVKS